MATIGSGLQLMKDVGLMPAATVDKHVAAVNRAPRQAFAAMVAIMEDVASITKRARSSITDVFRVRLDAVDGSGPEPDVTYLVNRKFVDMTTQAFHAHVLGTGIAATVAMKAMHLGMRVDKTTRGIDTIFTRVMTAVRSEMECGQTWAMDHFYFLAAHSRVDARAVEYMLHALCSVATRLPPCEAALSTLEHLIVFTHKITRGALAPEIAPMWIHVGECIALSVPLIGVMRVAVNGTIEGIPQVANDIEAGTWRRPKVTREALCGDSIVLDTREAFGIGMPATTADAMERVRALWRIVFDNLPKFAAAVGEAPSHDLTQRMAAVLGTAHTIAERLGEQREVTNALRARLARVPPPMGPASVSTAMRGLKVIAAPPPSINDIKRMFGGVMHDMRKLHATAIVMSRVMADITAAAV
jgi:hypothetical protein